MSGESVPFDLGYVVPDEDDCDSVDCARATHASSKFDPKVPEHQRALQERIDAVIAEYRTRHPEVQGLAVRASVSVRPRRPKGFYKVPGAILQHMLIRSQCQQTQEAILMAIRPQFPMFSITKNIWTEEQQRWQLRRLCGVVQRHGVIARLSGCRTLADFRRALQAAAVTRSGHEFKTTITISDTQVTIGEMVLKIGTALSNGSTYRTIRPNVEKLRTALLAGRRNRKKK